MVEWVYSESPLMPELGVFLAKSVVCVRGDCRAGCT